MFADRCRFIFSNFNEQLNLPSKAPISMMLILFDPKSSILRAVEFENVLAGMYSILLSAKTRRSIPVKKHSSAKILD